MNYYDSKCFLGENLLDYRNLKDNPLYVHLKKGKKDEGYYLGMYINEEPNKFSEQVNCLTSYVNEFRNHNWFFEFGMLEDFTKNEIKYVCDCYSILCNVHQSDVGITIWLLTYINEIISE
ncbi:hypothetical protein [Aquimarina mytili]|uniref:Uncharacterized protein n=1 Tax=Aquimarina mytili TaxID=874423 RepID=A0A937A1V9_9FLAO|nr:hypothetical protein [Aquimarina mytili]MBL0685351.1 hypothetical protein [Aquimarina mytili]